MTSPDPVSRSRWYHEPYAWLVAMLPATAVVAGFYTLHLAIASDDGLVTDDYYKKGLEINRVLERDQYAQALGLDAVIVQDRAHHRITVKIQAHDNFQAPAVLALKLMHAPRPGLDRDLELRRVSGLTYAADVDELRQGHWYAQVETPQWRILRSMFVNHP